MKQIDIRLCTHEPYAPFPKQAYTLGRANLNDVIQMMELLESGTLPPGSCIDSMYANMEINARLTRRTNKAPQFWPVLNISDLWPAFHPITKCTGTEQPDHISALKKCAENLATGKCHDECMRRTLGTLLYPQYYASQKQK